ncbi:UDP-N-acetylmuramoyl-L-alanine--D-glutamate ligase [Candidatus Margulisiibacteriota bacterium]
MMHVYKNKRVTIFGMGISGIAVAKKLQAMGARIIISEKNSKDKFERKIIDELAGSGIKLEFGGHTLYSISGADLIVVSPGIRIDLPILKEARRHQILVVSEIELACRFLHKPIIAVTGTNGKTTTTTLIGEFLKQAGKKVAVVGNIGAPLIALDDRELDFIVAEISSYQLEGILTFRPWISVLLNVAEDHLERHRGMEGYMRAKAKIFQNQRKNDYLIYNAQDEKVCRIVQVSQARRIPFAVKDIFFDPNQIILKGQHNFENIMAAAYAARLAGVTKQAITRVLENFAGVKHRIEFIKKVNAVSFYNDSKATNPDSTVVALKTLAARAAVPNIVLILGGVDKKLDLTAVIKEIKKSVKEVVLIGAAAYRFNHELVQAGFNRISFAASLPEAVQKSYKLAKDGDQVLLSPGCSSFDMFSNFEERGEIFKRAALGLAA